MKDINWRDFARIFVYGIVFWIIAYLLSGDTSSIIFGILVMYLEYKFMKLQKVKK